MNWATQRWEFETNGYVLAKGLFHVEQVEKACQWLLSQDPNVLRKSWTEAEPGVPLAIYSVIHETPNPIGEIAADRRITDYAGELMSESTYIWSSKVNVKASWCGAVEYYHQDFIYWKDRGYPTDRMLSCMVFLQPHGLANAGLHVIPGSHRQGLITHEPFVNTNGLAKWMIPPQTLNELYGEHGIAVIEAEPGDALFFHTSLVHGSSHNISPHGRMICLVQMNTMSNEPRDVSMSAKEFNLQRAQLEVSEAQRRLDFFSAKLQKQQKSIDLTFGAPIPREERK